MHRQSACKCMHDKCCWSRKQELTHFTFGTGLSFFKAPIIILLFEFLVLSFYLPAKQHECVLAILKDTDHSFCNLICCAFVHAARTFPKKWMFVFLCLIQAVGAAFFLCNLWLPFLETCKQIWADDINLLIIKISIEF